MGAPYRVFLLSPARCEGERARILLRPEARFDLARRLRTRRGAMIAEAFLFLSGLYFRGKLAYALAFARPPPGSPGIFVITSSRGLLLPTAHVTARQLLAFKDVPIDAREPAFAGPLVKSVRPLARRKDVEVVLLGSIATGKYVDVLAPLLGPRLLFPECFVGRGDMSRGGILLRAVDAGQELPYAPVQGARRHGSRPPRLPPRVRPTPG